MDGEAENEGFRVFGARPPSGQSLSNVWWRRCRGSAVCELAETPVSGILTIGSRWKAGKENSPLKSPTNHVMIDKNIALRCESCSQQPGRLLRRHALAAVNFDWNLL